MVADAKAIFLAQLGIGQNGFLGGIEPGLLIGAAGVHRLGRYGEFYFSGGQVVGVRGETGLKIPAPCPPWSGHKA